ncbi:hypothetical protein [Arthrobacter sp. NPDC090010]|uniref:hypothetical protein n=1 Tax=Arthrobacter sp. NPDC090010 TaxID=3363942 RepID=UPI00381FC746
MSGWGLFDALLNAIREPHTGAGKDDFGNATETFGPAEYMPISSFDPGGSRVVFDGGYERRVVTEPMLIAPYETALADRDRVTIPGHGTFIVNGVPDRWSHPMPGMPSGTVAKLRRVDG